MKKILLLAVLCGIAPTVFAAEEGGEKDKDWSIAMDGRIIAAKGGENSVHRGTVYVEKGLTEELAVFFYGSAEQGERSAYAGLARWFVPEKLQVGLGIGSSKYDLGEGYGPHRVTAGWLYAVPFEDMEVEVSVEKYSTDPDPWWWQATVKYNIGERVFVGMLGEKGVGWGPLVGGTLVQHWKVWAVVPIVKDGEDKARFITVLGYSY